MHEVLYCINITKDREYKGPIQRKHQTSLTVMDNQVGDKHRAKFSPFVVEFKQRTDHIFKIQFQKVISYLSGLSVPNVL